MYKRIANSRLSVIVINIFIVFTIWYLVSLSNFTHGTVPNPLCVIKVLFSNEIVELFSRLATTIINVFGILFVSTLIGYFLGIICGLNRYLNSLLYPILNSIKSVPITVLLPVFVAVFHLKYFLYPLITLPLVANLSVNISQAILKVNENRIDLMKLLHIKKFYIIKHVYFWESFEPLISTMRILITYALTIEIALDYFLTTSTGIGSYIFQQSNSYATDKYSYMFAGIFLVSIFGILSIDLLDLISNKLLKWKEKI